MSLPSQVAVHRGRRRTHTDGSPCEARHVVPAGTRFAHTNHTCVAHLSYMDHSTNRARSATRDSDMFSSRAPAASPISRLPEEILARILNELYKGSFPVRIPGAPFSPKPRTAFTACPVQSKLRLVCRHWHDIINNTPTFWSLVPPDRSSFDERLSRSQKCPLDIYAYYDGARGPALQLLASAFGALAIPENAVRIRSLFILFDSKYEAFPSLQALFESNMSNLRTLYFSSWTAFPPCDLRRFPNLRDVFVWGSKNLPPLEELPHDIRHLCLGHVSGSSQSLNKLAQTLQRTGCLESLNLAGNFLREALSDTVDSIFLPKLRRLTILAHPSATNRLLRALRAPNVERIDLDAKCEGRGPHSSDAIVAGCQQAMLDWTLAVLRRLWDNSEPIPCLLYMDLAMFEIYSEQEHNIVNDLADEEDTQVARIACSALGGSCRSDCKPAFSSYVARGLMSDTRFREVASSLVLGRSPRSSEGIDWLTTLSGLTSVEVLVLNRQLGEYEEFLTEIQGSAALPALREILFDVDPFGTQDDREALEKACGVLMRTSTRPTITLDGDLSLHDQTTGRLRHLSVRIPGSNVRMERKVGSIFSLSLLATGAV